MKRALIIFAIIVCVLTSVGCGTVDEGNDALNPNFIGEVLEKYENGCLVSVADSGNTSLNIGDKATVNTNIENCPQYDVGDRLRIVFDGSVAESYPMQIHGVFIVSIVDN